jgi:hypothetical protein
MQIELQLGPEFKRTVSDVSRMGDKIRRAAQRGLAEAVKEAAQHVSKNYLTGQYLKRRTGNLARSIDSRMVEEFHGVIGVLEESAVDHYKWILGDETKTIRPKSAKFLTIPIGEALTPSGVPRYSSPRDVEGGFFFTSDSGQLMFGIRRGQTKRAKIRPLFVLVKEVTIHGTGALADGVLESSDRMTEILSDRIGEAVND